MAQIMKEFSPVGDHFGFWLHYLFNTFISGKMLNESKRDFLNSDPHIFFYAGTSMYVFHATIVNNCIAQQKV